MAMIIVLWLWLLPGAIGYWIFFLAIAFDYYPWPLVFGYGY
jgi:hypothetical protein